MAKMAESAMAVVLMPTWASLRAMACPPYLGAPSATTTCQRHASSGHFLAEILTAQTYYYAVINIGVVQ